MTRRPHDLPPWACPSCGAVLDEAQGIADDHPPRPGDYTLCAHCLAVLEFDADLHLRRVPPDVALPALEVLDMMAVQGILLDWDAEARDRA